MKALIRLLQRIPLLNKRPVSPTPNFKNYNPFQGGAQSFRTGQDYAGEGQPKIRKKLKQKFSRSTNQQVTNYSLSKSGERSKIAILFRGIIAVTIIVAISYLGKPYFQRYIAGIKYFHIQEMNIAGCEVTQPEDIRQLGGFTYGTSLFLISPTKITERLQAHSWIAEVSVERQWPNSLSIVVKEHVPEALITQGDVEPNRLHYVNKKGICFTPVAPGEDVDFPVITGLDSLTDEQDRKMALADALYFLKLARRNNPNLPAQLVSEIHVDRVEGLTIYLVEHPFPIFFGRDQVKKKYKQLRKVLEILYKKQKNQMKITQVKYIRMDYLSNKVLVAQSGSG